MQLLSTVYIILFLSATTVFHLLAGSQYIVTQPRNLVCEMEAEFGLTRSVLECSIMCDRNVQCISFSFNVYDFSCNGSSIVNKDFTVCSFVNGTVYYIPAGDSNISQWVSSVASFSSQYTTSSWSANQIIGSPNVFPAYGNNARSWAPRDINANQFIEVMFSTAVYITQVDVYETDHCGAVKKISARDDASGQLHVLWETPAATVIYQARIFAPPISKTSFKSALVRLDVDQTAANTWIEIDAIQLHGELW